MIPVQETSFAGGPCPIPDWFVPTFRPKRRLYSQRRDSRYIAQIIARTPAIESTATTQKSIATTHAPSHRSPSDATRSLYPLRVLS